MPKYTTKFVFITIFALAINVLYIPKALAAVSGGSLVSLANTSRTQAGLATLSTNSQLEQAAAMKAADMFTNQYFAHTSPQGKTPWDFISAAGYNYVYAGENLAIGYTNSSELHNAWMNSPSHRENIMNPNFRDIGIAVVDGDYEGAPTTIVVQEFGSTETSQPVAENQTQTEEISNTTNGSENQPTEGTPANTKAYELLMDKTKFTPNKIFTGEEVEFQATLKGEVSELYINVGQQKIDLLDSLKNDGEEKLYVKKEKILKEGEQTVTLTAVDRSGNREVKDLGKLTVAKKLIVKGTTSNSGFWGGITKFVNQNITYIALMISLITLGLGAYLIFRYRKFGKMI